MKRKQTLEAHFSSELRRVSIMSVEEKGSSEKRAMCGSRNRLGWFQVSMGKHGSGWGRGGSHFPYQQRGCFDCGRVVL